MKKMKTAPVQNKEAAANKSGKKDDEFSYFEGLRVQRPQDTPRPGAIRRDPTEN